MDVGSQYTPPDLSEQPRTQKRARLTFWVLLIAVIFLLVGIVAYFLITKPAAVRPATTKPEKPSITTPAVTMQVMASGLDHPWDIEFLPDGTGLFTERIGKISILKNTSVVPLATVDDVKAVGEGGLMGLAVDPDFATNRSIYTCYNTDSDIRVVRWKVTIDLTALADKH